MQLLLTRTTKTDKVTLGELSIDGVFFCHTLEDPVRETKIPGETAIPAGTYPIQLTYSPKFKRLLPLLVGVPGYEGVRIHAGNTTADTEGCILVGQSVGSNTLFQSRLAFGRLMEKLNGEQALSITIA